MFVVSDAGILDIYRDDELTFYFNITQRSLYGFSAKHCHIRHGIFLQNFELTKYKNKIQKHLIDESDYMFL